MDRTRIIAIVMALLVAALAGYAVCSEEYDAADVTITYQVDTDKYVKVVQGAGIITLPTLEELGADAKGRTFLGWESSGVVYPAGSKVTASSDVTYTASFKLVYDLTFKGADGTVLKVISGALDAPITETIPIPEPIAGKHFVGWYKNGDTSKVIASDDITKIGGDITYTAAYETVYKVDWYLEGVKIASGTSIDLNQPDEPIAKDYEFVGWFDRDGVKFGEGYKFVKDTEFEAKFTPVAHTVKFVYGPDAKVFMTETVLHGELAVRPAELPEGYKSWDFNFSAPIMKDTTISAVADVYYAVTFMAGDKVVSAITVLEDTAIPADQVPAVPEGCTGWDFNFSKRITKDTTIYAIEIVFHTVDFNYLVNYIGENGHVYRQVEDGKVIAADQIPEIPDYFIDKKWGFDASKPITSDIMVKLTDVIYYKVTFKDGDKAVSVIDVKENTVVPMDKIPALADGKKWKFDFTQPINADTTIVSVVVHDVYDVTFKVEGKEPVTQKSDALAPPSTDRAGYTFQGWIVEGKDGVFVNPMTYYYTCDTTFVAVYKAIGAVYTVTFLVEGKEPVVQKSDALSPPATDRTGYAFQGWIVQGQSGKYVDPMSYTYTCDTTFIAVYKQAYLVTFIMEGKSTVTMSSAKVVCPDPTRSGYDFKGWFVQGDPSRTYVDPEKYDYKTDTEFEADYSKQPAPFYENPVIITILALIVIFAVCGVAYGVKSGKLKRRS